MYFSLYKSNSNWFSFWAFNNCTREDNWLIFYTSEQKDSLCKQDSKLKNFLKSLNVHINFMFRTNILRNTKHCTILFCDKFIPSLHFSSVAYKHFWNHCQTLLIRFISKYVRDTAPFKTLFGPLTSLYLAWIRKHTLFYFYIRAYHGMKLNKNDISY